MTGLKRADLIDGAGTHLRVIGKGRKERRPPLARSTLAVLKAWLREPQRGDGDVLFPSAQGERLSVHGVQYLLTKHRMAACKICPSLKEKLVTVHRLRHRVAMDLLQAGVDRSVIALWLGHEWVETTLSRSHPRHEGAGACENIAAKRKTWALSAWRPTAWVPEQSVEQRKRKNYVG
jgi:site-specific recombinase XerD